MLDTSLADPLKFWVGYERELLTLSLYGVGLAIYGVIVTAMNTRIAAQNPFATKDEEPVGGFWRAVGGAARWLTIFPLLAFGYLMFLSFSLFVLAKNQTVPSILLMAVSLVTAIRIASWFSENTSRDLAKLVPFGLLGVLIVEPGYLNVETIRARFEELPTLVPVLSRYLLLFFLLELASRPALAIRAWSRKRRGLDEQTRRVPVQGTTSQVFARTKK